MLFVSFLQQALGDFNVLSEWISEQVEKEIGDESARKFENEK